MRIGKSIFWGRGMATIAKIDGDDVLIHLDCNMTKWVSMEMIKIYNT